VPGSEAPEELEKEFQEVDAFIGSGEYDKIPEIVLRLKRALSVSELSKLNAKFRDILVRGKIEQFDERFEEEKTEYHTLGLKRLSLYFDRHNFARLHQLIREINKV